MKFEPSRYHRFERDPIGCFKAEMTVNGWTDNMFDHDLQTNLPSDAIKEFVLLVNTIFHQCPTWKELNNFANKQCTKVRNDDGMPVAYVTYLCEQMDYVVRIDGMSMEIFPYRKFKH